jgi:formylglycine-generating enzyme required for sulfatase activity
MSFVYIPPGKFMMGDEYSGPIHEVTLTTGFLMQTTPVTHKQWESVMGNNPARFKSCGNDCPVENVSWDDAQSFIQKLNEMEKENYDLPTEAQWEYACRAGSTTRYCYGDQESLLDNYAWYRKNSQESTHPVAQLKPNDWGLYDMDGNVWEWCRDLKGDYPNLSVIDPVGPDNGTIRVLRGGSWYNDADYCRSANSNRRNPVNRNRYYGFRLVRLPGQRGDPGKSS